MIESLSIIQSIIEQGLIYSLIVAGMYLTSRIINFDDLSIEGSFGIGGALIAQLLTKDLHPLISIIVAMAAGALTGLATGLLHTKLKLNNLISGIVVTTGLFSITIKVAGSNMALLGKNTLFTLFSPLLGTYTFLGILLLINIAVIYGIRWLLNTEIGYLLQAAGSAPQMLINLGKSVDTYIILALMLSNTLAALSGALFVQKVGYFSIWANVGILIISLAGLILAQAINTRFGLNIMLGAIAYQAIIALTFELQLDQDWNKLVTALLIVLLIVIQKALKKNGAKA